MAFISYSHILFVIIFFVFLCYNNRHRKGKKCSPPTNWPVIGMMPGLIPNIHHVHDYITDVLAESGCTFEFKGPWFANVNLLLTCDPANIHYILSKNFPNFPKGPDYKEIFDILGDGIFNAESESWDIQRRTTMSLLKHQGFQKFVLNNTWNKVDRGMIPVLDHVAKLGIDLDLQELIQRFTFDITCILIVDHDPASLSIDFPDFPYKQAFAEAEEALLYRHVLPEAVWKLQRWLKVGKEKKLSRAEGLLDQFLTRCIVSKREKLNKTEQSDNNPEGYFDFLSGYIKTLEEKRGGSEIPEKAWKDTLLNLIFAGKDTIGATLTWFFCLVTTNPIEEKKIRDEILRKLGVPKDGEGWNFLDAEELNKLVYLHAALCESLRLFPPVGLQHKAPIEGDILPSGHRIKPNTKTVLSFYSMARMEQIWGRDCLEFKPERWISEQGGIKHVPSFKFTAFNAGPRSCLGKEMSFIQMKIVAAAVIYHFGFDAVGGQSASPCNSVILNMRHGFKVRVRRRSAPHL